MKPGTMFLPPHALMDHIRLGTKHQQTEDFALIPNDDEHKLDWFKTSALLMSYIVM